MSCYLSFRSPLPLKNEINLTKFTVISRVSLGTFTAKGSGLVAAKRSVHARIIGFAFIHIWSQIEYKDAIRNVCLHFDMNLLFIFTCEFNFKHETSTIFNIPIYHLLKCAKVAMTYYVILTWFKSEIIRKGIDIELIFCISYYTVINSI